MKRQIIITIFISLAIAVSTIAIYHFLANPQQVVMKEIENANFVRENEVLLNGKMSKVFNASKPDDFIETAKKTVESVVFIRTTKKLNVEGQQFHPEFYRSTGSGVIISSDGLVVSNHHVIEDAEEIKVTLHDKREYEAELLGYDQSTDLALLKIEEVNLPFLFFGDSDSLQVGEWVLAVGNPFRLQSSVTAGIVSAKARNINLLQRNGIEAYIQTDAAVNPGNSGGALVNTQGLLVGIIAALMSESGRYEGFSFAIPSTLAQKVIYDIQKFGSVQRGWLGITIVPVDQQIAEENKLKKVKGVFIQGVSKNSAASDAGIKRGDIVSEVNGTEVHANADFMELIARHRPGEKVELIVIRDGKEKQITATLKNSMNTYDFISIRSDRVLKDLGFELREMNSNEKSFLKGEGVLVVSILVGSKMDEINMEPGYIITSLNGKRIKTIDEFISALEASDKEVKLDGYYKNYPGKHPYLFEK